MKTGTNHNTKFRPKLNLHAIRCGHSVGPESIKQQNMSSVPIAQLHFGVCLLTYFSKGHQCDQVCSANQKLLMHGWLERQKERNPQGPGLDTTCVYISLTCVETSSATFSVFVDSYRLYAIFISIFRLVAYLKQKTQML